jgi:hypothetical protein
MLRELSVVSGDEQRRIVVSGQHGTRQACTDQERRCGKAVFYIHARSLMTLGELDAYIF